MERSVRTSSERSLIPIGQLLKNTLAHIEAAAESSHVVSGLSTGYNKLDQITYGLQKSDLIILAGRPSMGKSTLAMNIAENVTLNQNKPVALFSMEMSARLLILRILASMGRIDHAHIQSGKMDEQEYDRLGKCYARLKDAPMFIDYTPNLSTKNICSLLTHLTRKHGEPSLIVVDCLQLLKFNNSSNNSPDTYETLSCLKQLASDFNCPLIATSQLSSHVDSRPNKRPITSDFLDAESIEALADLIVFLYRDEEYNMDSFDKGIAEIIIGRQRNGPKGTIKMTFNGHLARFDD